MQGTADLIDGEKYKIKNYNNPDYKLSINAVGTITTTLDNIGVSWELEDAGATDTWYLRNIKHNCRLGLNPKWTADGTMYLYKCFDSSDTGDDVKWVISGNESKNRMCIMNASYDRYISEVVSLDNHRNCNKGKRRWKFVKV